jgi:hypothetical protein
MKLSDNIEKLIRESNVLDVDTSSKMDQRIIEDALNAQKKIKETKLAGTQPDIWRIIMKSRISKLAAAAAIMIAALLAIHVIDGSSVTLAGVLEEVEKAKAYTYKMNVKVTGSMMPGWPMGQDMTGTVTISKDLGMKTEMEMIDPNTGEPMTQEK